MDPEDWESEVQESEEMLARSEGSYVCQRSEEHLF